MHAPIYTVGHGNRTAEELLGLLEGAQVHALEDVRAHPGSRRHPQFSQATLARELEAAGIAYRWEGAALGGRRRPHPGSRHLALRNASFRAYADHMETAAFREAMATLMARAASAPTAIMCAERLPWQCHRYLIADYLVAHGVPVVHLVALGSARYHALNPIARLEDNVVVYDRLEQGSLPLGS